MKILASLAAMLALATSASVAQAKTLTARAGDTTATISWSKKSAFEAANVRLTIARSGQTVYDQPILGQSGQPTPDIPQAVKVRDVDGDGHEDVIADLYTGGAHCCSYSLLLHWDAARNDYVTIRKDWGDLGYRLEELGGKPGLELVSADDRFAYQFTSFAGSAFPIQIWRLAPAGFEDVTGEYPALVRRNAASLWRGYRRTVRSDYPDVRGVLAAWAADEARLGRAEAAFRRLEGLARRGVLSSDRPWPSGAKYLEELGKFLRTTGYLRG